MSQEMILVLHDLREARGWFRTHRSSKIIVILGFLLVIAVTMACIFGISYAYFRNLSMYGSYGQATATYLIHAALLVISILAVGSSTAAAVNFLFTKNRKLDYLKALPIKDSVIVQWFAIKNVLLAGLLFSILIIPVLSAYSIGLLHGLTFPYIARSVFLMIVLTIMTHSIGSLLAFVIVPVIGKNKRMFFLLGMFSMLLGIIGILRIIFPSTLATLYYAPPEQFNVIYHSLPLANPYLPTLWMTMIVISNTLTPVVSLAIATILVAVGSHYVQSNRYNRVYQNLQSVPFEQTSATPITQDILKEGDPLFLKDILSIIRSPSEVGYIVFLMALAIFFFVFLFYAGSFRYASSMWGIGLITFTLGWLLFFVTAFLLRLVFPLMAHEKKTIWYLFPLPLPASQIVISKMKACLVISSLFVLFSVILWGVAPIPAALKVFLIVVSSWAILSLSLIHVTLGMIRTNFADGDEPEKVSTSMMGMLALACSILIVSGVCYSVYTMLATGLLPVYFGLSATVCSIILPFYLLVKAKSSVEHYEFQ